MLIIVSAYLVVGAGVAAWLHAARLSVVDPGVKGAGFFFRLVITPGLIALWPVMLSRARRAKEPPAAEHCATARVLRSRHRVYTQLVASAIPVIVGAALAARPSPVVNSVGLPSGVQQPAPLGIVVRELPDVLPGHAIVARVRRNENGSAHQLELDVRETIAARAATLYFQPQSVAGGPVLASVYLGPVPGAGTYRFALPETWLARGGRFVMYDAASGSAL